MVSKIICFDKSRRYGSWIKSHPQYSRYRPVSLSGPLTNVTEDFRCQFLRAYVDCVGQLSVHNHSLLWWASDISSKNRFSSTLLFPLEQFFKLMRLVDTSKEDVLLITDVPFRMMPSLRRAMMSRQVLCEWHGLRSLPAAEILKGASLRGGRLIRYLFYTIPRIIKARRLFGPLINERSTDKTPVYLIKTFISAGAFDPAGRYKDLFFGPLPDFLSQNDRVIVLAHVMDDFSKTLSLMKQYGGGNLYPMEAFMTIKDLFKASFQIAFFKIHIPQSLDFRGNDVSDLAARVCREQGSKVQPLHLYQYMMMKRFLEKFSVHTFLMTCEFNPWEKMCIWALREGSSAVKILGYQHTVVPQASANMFIGRFEEGIIPRPGLILTVGQKPKDIIARYENSSSSNIKAACGLRFEYLSKQSVAPRQKRGHVLLALEGLPQVVEMTNYVLGQWASCEGYHLRIRTHVVLPLEKIKDQLTSDPSSMPRVEISKTSSLQEDLSWADIVIYWGSTVALEALSMGKPVVHYDNGSLLSFDPLFELNDFKWRITRNNALKDILDEINGLPDTVFEEKRQKAKAYIAAYFHPVTPDAMSLFV